MKNRNNSNYINTSFLLDSIEAWEEDEERRFNLDKLNSSFRESVPILEFIDWKISSIKRGYVETILPLNPNSSNQYITHQAALMLLSADYTGGLAIASLFHLSPVVGFPLSELTVSGGGTYTSAPTVTIAATTGDTTGTGATATAILGFPVASISLDTDGLGYRNVPTVTISGDPTTAAVITPEANFGL